MNDDILFLLVTQTFFIIASSVLELISANEKTSWQTKNYLILRMQAFYANVNTKEE